MRGTKLGLSIVATAGIFVATAAQSAAAPTVRAFTTSGTAAAAPFHSHPLIRVAPPAGSVNSPPSGNLLSSNNWSGYAVNGGPFHAASGCWTVPSVSGPNGQLAFSSAWVGIDGYDPGDSYLIQTGTEQDWDGTAAQYFAWWEVITPTSPTPATVIGGVNPGDQMCASIAIGSPDSTISISDQTSGAQFSTQQPYAGTDTSAEWIMEAPFVRGSFGSCGPCPLADYGQTNFDPVSVSGHNPALASNNGIEMNEGSGGPVVSIPSNPDTDLNGFTVAYGSNQPLPPPALLSLSPSSGPVTGGQPVTIGGSGFEPGGTVAFGSTLASGVTFISPTQLSVTTPAEPAGTVGVTVTNPTGPSSTEPSAYTFVPGGGYTVDEYGGLHPYGDAPYESVAGAYYPGFNIIRGVALDTCDPSGHSGWTVDGYGGMHQFGAAPYVSVYGGYYPGFDIIRGAVAWCDQGHAVGYTVDAYGGMHPFSDDPGGVVPSYPQITGYWSGQQLTAGIVLIPGTDEGYVADAYGGLHPFNGAPYYNVSGYYPGFNIIRGVTLLPGGGGGYTLDAYGGLHPFGSAPYEPVSDYYPGWDIMRGVVASSATGGYALDAFGGLHPYGTAPYLGVTGDYPGQYIIGGVVFSGP